MMITPTTRYSVVEKSCKISLAASHNVRRSSSSARRRSIIASPRWHLVVLLCTMHFVASSAASDKEQQYCSRQEICEEIEALNAKKEDRGGQFHHHDLDTEIAALKRRLNGKCSDVGKCSSEMCRAAHPDACYTVKKGKVICDWCDSKKWCASKSCKIEYLLCDGLEDVNKRGFCQKCEREWIRYPETINVTGASCSSVNGTYKLMLNEDYSPRRKYTPGPRLRQQRPQYNGPTENGTHTEKNDVTYYHRFIYLSQGDEWTIGQHHRYRKAGYGKQRRRTKLYGNYLHGDTWVPPQNGWTGLCQDCQENKDKDRSPWLKCKDCDEPVTDEHIFCPSIGFCGNNESTRNRVYSITESPKDWKIKCKLCSTCRCGVCKGDGCNECHDTGMEYRHRYIPPRLEHVF